MKFSCIMPVYNGAAFLRKAIDSVLSQSYPDLELIVVDDGSTDETLSVARNAGEEDARVHVLALPHGGVSRARNVGIDAATGEYLLFIDGDDTWHPELLKHAAEALDDRTELLVFGIALHRLAADGSLIGVSPELSEDGSTASHLIREAGDLLFSRYNMSSPCNKVYRTDRVKESGVRFSPACVYLEDLKFNLDYLSVIDSITVMQRNLYNYRVFVEANQIKKRRFGTFPDNADALFLSAESYLSKKGLCLAAMPTLMGIVRNAYLLEYLSAIAEKEKKERRRLFRILGNSRGFMAVTAHSGRFFALFRLLMKLRLFRLSSLLLERRFR